MKDTTNTWGIEWAGLYQVERTHELWAAVEAKARERNATDLHPGGRYLVNGVIVDAEGHPVE